MNDQAKQGVIYAMLAYTMWGIAPIFFKQLQFMPSLEILAHRIIWSALLLVVIIGLRNNLHKVKAIFASRRQLSILFISASLLGFNWWLFIWAINNDHILDASLGYYINPLLNIALGMVFLKERLSKLQYVAVALAVTGVAIQLVTFGSFPYIALSLAVSFAIYGLIRKTVSVDAMPGLLIESLVMIVPAFVYWFVFASSSATNLLDNTWTINALIVGAGLVTTAPLLCFVEAARRLNYSTLGFFQYIGPSLMFILAVFVYGEEFGQDRWVTFGFIWAALVVYSYASYRNIQKSKTSV
ncbi:EamA family transporter RarD [Psychrosphaera ytuae]|uniref:EamA family transporter RarD n=1 Tax=Psychrosphaera ytuae TaxID=2820710 RepID=A0A975HJ27_9GAMM|nr:EamA family transporter RarD [Psychrosphaera ytuae]QTH62774.1 EamA family transporter RarD [Psychrosphaera ytuae]